MDYFSRTAITSISVVSSSCWLLIITCIFISIIMFGLIMRKCKPIAILEKKLLASIGSMLPWLFCIVWCIGFILYCIGAREENKLDFFAVVPMAIIHATEMFLTRSEVSIIPSTLRSDQTYMALFNICHFAAMLCTMMFVFRHFVFYIAESLWMKIRCHLSYIPFFKPSQLYVFWGLNEASFILAESIMNKNTNEKNTKNITKEIAFVRTSEDGESQSSRMEFSKFFNKIKMRDEDINRLREIGCLITDSYHRLSLLKLHDNDHDILEDKLDLHSLSSLIKSTNDVVYFFFLGNDENNNLAAVANLLKDRTLKTKKVRIYCHAYKSPKTQWLEHYNLMHPHENISVTLIDTSYLSIAELKQDVKYHPVNYVDIEKKDASVNSTFNSLIVGFGETGYEGLKFLYEYGAFINSQKKKSQFKCYLFDKDIETKKGEFCSYAPALKDSDEFEFINCTIDSKPYWDKLEKILPELHYAIICPGNDSLALDTAVKLCTMARRLKKGNHKLTFYVRSYKEENLHQLEEIQVYINNTCADMNINLEIFGRKRKLYSYDLIVDDNILHEAMQYNYAYGDYEKNKSMWSKEEAWCIDLGIKKIVNPNDDEFNSDKAENAVDKNNPNKLIANENLTLSSIEEIERKKNQNISNAFHRKTKIFILKHCNAFPNPSKEIQEKMARLEHERWIAASKVSGWRQMIVNQENIRYDNGKDITQTKDITKKKHADITGFDNVRDWDEKSKKSTQSFDYKVLTTSIMLEQGVK